MLVLIAVASRHGSTMEIADAIAAAIRSCGVEVDVKAVESVLTLEQYEAVVLGSGVYAGHWLRAARAFAEEYAIDLKGLPVWLFSSGPVGDPPKPIENPVEVESLSQRVSARGHRLFPGKIENAHLGLSEKAMVRLVRAQQGDYRPWAEIGTWGRRIAAQLLEPASFTV